MADPITSSIEKALALNLDPLKYGTIVEIGAGHEVARWFFQAGAAAGTVAKTMSAYEMNFSDEIYGTSSDKRYVSKARLENMLEDLGQLFPEKTVAYIYPATEDGQTENLDDVAVPAHLDPLLIYLKERSRVISIDGYADDDGS